MFPWKLRGPSAGLQKRAARKTQHAAAADDRPFPRRDSTAVDKRGCLGGYTRYPRFHGHGGSGGGVDAYLGVEAGLVGVDQD